MSLAALWTSWQRFRRGKRASSSIHSFQYHLEAELAQLADDLAAQTYRHGAYHHFETTDTKRRQIAVAEIRDRVVHRLLYDFLIPIFDPTFHDDVWSCRRGKGLLGAIDRTELFLGRYPASWVWRADIRKFFDHVDHDVLKLLLRRRVTDARALHILGIVIDSYPPEVGSASAGFHDATAIVRFGVAKSRERAVGAARHGIPIGNLTSQIFANIYLNELDRFVVHTLKPQAYLRYGDDFIVIGPKQPDVIRYRTATKAFLIDKLRLALHPRNDIIVKGTNGLKFLGVEIFPTGRRLRQRMLRRVRDKLTIRNSASYRGLIHHHQPDSMKWFDWLLVEKTEQETMYE